MTESLTKLYRQYLRQINRLPVLYLRQFFRLKAADDARAVARTKDTYLCERKYKRVRKDVRKLEAANRGDAKAFAHILDLAYGRKGKLKRELIEPLLLNPRAERPPRIISSVEKSRPPVYLPELRALLTSSLSRVTRPLRDKDLDGPPTLPVRTADEVRLIGHFSKRREINIRWRHFTNESKKVLPPLQIVGKERNADNGHEGDDLQFSNVFRELQQLVGPPWKSRNLTRRELHNLGTPHTTPSLVSCTAQHHGSRWLRRRFQQLLGRTPILNYQLPKSGSTQMTVTLSPGAISNFLRFPTDRIPQATLADIQWSNAVAKHEERLKNKKTKLRDARSLHC